MYKIQEEKLREKYILMIPAMLDWHFPLLKYAFYSKEYHPVILENEEGITDLGLTYVNNDMCYPAILNIGQMIGALKSGKYDVDRVALLMPQAGDACRGSNYTGVLRRAVKCAGFPQVPVLSLNAKGLEKDQQVKITPAMVWRALFAVFYSDALMLLTNQIRPYEKISGDTKHCLDKWQEYFAKDLKQGKNLTFAKMKKNLYLVAEDFARIPRESKELKKVGIVGELYVKYCHLGNWELRRFLREENCEYIINGVTWYVCYYIDTHLMTEKGIMALLYRAIGKLAKNLQQSMVSAIRENGLKCPDAFPDFKENAKDCVSYSCTVGDGWLIGAEAVNHIKNGYSRIIAVQPFGCMPNHVCGRGLYPSLQRRFPEAQIVSVDFDSSGSKLNVKNRIRLLLDYKPPVHKNRESERKKEDAVTDRIAAAATEN